MVNPVSRVNVEFTGTFQKLSRSVDQINGKLGGFEKKAKKVGGNVKAVFGGLAIGFGAKSFGDFVKGALDAGDKIQKLSTRLGASTEALSELRHVASLSGVSFESMTMGIQRMTRRLSEAANGSGEAVKALQELGLSAERINKLSPDQQFEVLADALAGVENQADKVRLAMKFFDSEGVALLQTMENGAAGIRGMRDEAEALGLTISKDTADAFVKANDALTRSQAQFTALGQTIAIKLAPTIESFAKFFVDTIPGALDFGKVAIMAWRQAVVSAFADVVTGYASLVNKLANAADFLGFDDTAKSMRMAAGEMRNFSRDLTDLSQFYVTDAAPAVGKFNSSMEKTGKVINLADFRGATQSSAEFSAQMKKQADAAKKAADAMKKLNEETAKGLEEVRQAVETDVQAITREFEDLQIKLDEARALGHIDADEFIKLDEALSKEKLERLNDLVEDSASQMSEFAAEAARNMQSSFADFLFDPFENGLDGMLDGFINTLRRMAAEQASSMILNQVGSSLSGKSGAWGQLGASLIGAAAGSAGNFAGASADLDAMFAAGELFADGGVMTDRGAVPLKRYASGGVASSPQLAMFGEGSGSEAYVPLPDGRRIPVAMEGGGGGPMVNITVHTPDAASFKRSRASLASDVSRSLAVAR